MDGWMDEQTDEWTVLSRPFNSCSLIVILADRL